MAAFGDRIRKTTYPATKLKKSRTKIMTLSMKMTRKSHLMMMILKNKSQSKKQSNNPNDDHYFR